MISWSKMKDLKLWSRDRIVPVLRNIGRHIAVFVLTIFFGFLRALQQILNKGFSSLVTFILNFDLYSGNNGESFTYIAPQCLNNLEFGTHSSTKIDVGWKNIKIHWNIFPFSGHKVSFCWEWINCQHDDSLSSRLLWLLVRMEVCWEISAILSAS